MIRRHLFEFEDLPWIPAWWRDYMTDGLEMMMAVTGAYSGAAAHIRRLIQNTGETRIVDLGSGAGGPAVRLLRKLRADHPELRLTLTDKFPNRAAFEKTTSSAATEALPVECRYESIDAVSPPRDLQGVRTMFTSFHHLDDTAAEQVLRNAAESRAPLAIFETTGRTPAHALMILFVPLALALLTPFIRPFSFRRLLVTYLIPLVPLGCLWDGLVSVWRTYTPAELRALARKIQSDDYYFEVGTFRGALGVDGTYLLGIPLPVARSANAED